MAAFSMENWPVLDDAMREELIQLQDTHRIVPIPAYESSRVTITSYSSFT